MYKNYILVIGLLLLLVLIPASHAQKINLNFKEIPLQSEACNYLTPQDIQTAYNFNPLYSKGINGKGQNIAIVVAYGDSQLQQDVNAYDSYYGLSALTNGSNLFIEYPFGKPSSSSTNWTGETALDVETIHSLAPGSNIYLIVAPNDSWLFQAVNYTIENINTDIISLSWGASEFGYNQQSIDYFNQILASGQSKGINIFVATGDSGAYNGQNTLNVNFPASSPNVIAVGGTRLSVYSNGDYESEVGWNQSGGGDSQFFSRPSFQPDISSYRMVPDVAFNAGTPVCVYVNSTMEGFYGTSVAAPSFAALDALVNQNAGNDIGYLDDSLYKIYNSLGSLVFNNITSGCNGFYCADGSYNRVTGLGSPKAFQLVDALSNTSYYITFNDPNNGIFSVNNKNYSDTQTLKFSFGEKIKINAYSQNASNSGEKNLFTSFSGILNSKANSTYFFVNESGVINVNFNKYLRINEEYFNGIDNNSYYVKNGSTLKISAQYTENYSGYQYVLNGFKINNGTIIQKADYNIQVLYPLNVSYVWSKQTQTNFYFENYTPGLKANVSYYSYVPLSNLIKKVSTVIQNGSKVYSLPNSTMYIYGKPITIGANRYLLINKTQPFTKNITVNFLKEYNYTITFSSAQGVIISPKSFYTNEYSLQEKYTSDSLWALPSTNITLYKIDYDNVTLDKNVSFYTGLNRSINVTLPISDIKIKVVTILGIPVVGANVTLKIDNTSFSNSTNFFGSAVFSNVPKLEYNVTIAAYNSNFYFKNINNESDSFSITAGLYDIYIIITIIILAMAILAIYEGVRHKKHK
ncbi:MAG: peptidase S8 and S53 subtilisin kexin sedolisin [Candidatus Parvarchaeum acidophilus ARMAN-5]|jgi:subtilase family serine protease|uniref:Peptidase S8 and S53 subtilisin kexin sedolisin n=1 Tax=Candidatus Parvarchaeum acidophilus ARMAN-5 TaxID=662762 RepID=D6GVA8_PARA5|nr:MAG: peptidase S8 and S53 subtilisin kexin sedolisin [Candidatus Parvarchaeum acidophilus ARMAN-5]